LQRLIGEAAMGQELRDLHIVVPERRGETVEDARVPERETARSTKRGSMRRCGATA
jgi:hypothetical protein